MPAETVLGDLDATIAGVAKLNAAASLQQATLSAILAEIQKQTPLLEAIAKSTGDLDAAVSAPVTGITVVPGAPTTH